MKVTSLKKPQTTKNEAPSYLESATQEWFSSVVGEYQMEPHHIKLLTAACECWDRMEAARAAVAEKGLTMVDPKTLAEKARPEVNIERDSKIIYEAIAGAKFERAAPDSRPPKLKYGGR